MSSATVLQLTKVCTKCGLEKVLSEFYKAKHRGGPTNTKSSCKHCCAAYSSHKYHNTNSGQKARDHARVFARNNWARRLIYSCRVASRQRKARGRSCEVTITHLDLEALWEKQGGLCYFTGVPLATDQHRLDTVSADRVDPSRGYEPGNVVLSTKAANFARTGHGADEFLVFLMRMAKSLPSAPCAKGVL